MQSFFRTFLLAFIVTFTFHNSYTQTQPASFNTYRDLAPMQLASPGAFKFGLYGFSNPAILEYSQSSFDMQLSFNNAGPNVFEDDLNSWGVFTGLGNLGIGAFTRPTVNGEMVTDYRISMGGGTKDLSFGIGYGFAGENKSVAGLSNMYNLGLLYRPIEFVSVGLTYTKAFESSFDESVVDIGIRPIPDWPLTFFGDYSYIRVDEDNWGDIAMLGNSTTLGSWSAGAALEFPFLEGVRFNFRYTDSELDIQDMVMGGVDVSLGTSGLSYATFQPETDGISESYTTHFRFGAFDRTFLDDIAIFDNFIKLDLSGAITYQPFMYFDKRQSFLSILDAIDRAAKDDNVSGLFVNAVGMGGSYAMKWEIREKLREFKEDYDKEVVIFIERESIADYHFASIADRIVIDELGSVMINGFASGRSYYENLLEKIDVGYTELRYFKYKSAAEAFTREGFSEGEREQREAYLTDWYEIAKEDIMKARDLSDSEYEEIVNGDLMYDAEQLMELGLVDAVGRWNQLDDLESELAPSADLTLGSYALYPPEDPIDDQWSLDREKVAVIYADGVCAMEGGINARDLWRYVEQACESPDIGAIVLRVDSPGGDPLASEYIAKIIREHRDRKPIIVSQGMLAASGGYWLSMDADEIYTTPMTITGSIGVISSWIYDKGLKDSLGITYDYIKKGEFSDLGLAWSDPILGIGLPIRDLTEKEEELRKKEIMDLYNDFTERVAEGRGMDVEEVKEVAQGRVWTGKRAIGINLADRIGGLSQAIDRAIDLMDAEDPDDVIIVEYPPQGDFDFQRLLPSLLPISLKTVDASIEKINFIYSMNGLAYPMLPLDWQGDQNFQNPGADNPDAEFIK